MPTADVDAAAIVATLLAHDVEFVVIGGFAVELWGVAVPPTVDIDITPERSHDNLERLANALDELGAQLRSGDERVPVGGGFSADLLAGGRIWNLWTSAGPIDITLEPAGTHGYSTFIAGIALLDYRGVAVPTADLADVARSKEAAGRAKDLMVLPAILDHLRRSG
ncbi:MAG: hypothetical protein AB1Z57_01315 [Acidimicrobiia bacterium]